ncbi:MAG: rod shape-determining protein MreC [Bacillota bacterium]|nr:rod shape-determining protein MreC [Bacillota bacterium]
MSDFFKSVGFKILMGVISLLLVLIVISAATGVPILANVAGFITSPLNSASANAVKNLDATKKSAAELQAENDKLESQIETLRTQLVDYYNLKQENVRLWKYYDIKVKNPSYDMMPAAVIRRDPNENFYSFTADKGLLAGVSVNDPVITENGLIGWVDKVGTTTCTVKTILSPDTKVGVIDKNSRDSGVISGGTKYADQNKTMMTQISAKNTIKPGDIVTTTGIGGIYPPNIIVGEVSELKYNDFDTSLYAVIKPYEDVKNVKDVVIITGFTGQGEISIKNPLSTVSPTQPSTTPATGATQ